MATAAPATATALVPEERVSPAPRSQTPTVASLARVDAHELDVRPRREALVVLDERAEAEELGAVGVAADDRVRVADRDRRELDLGAVDRERLRGADLHSAHLGLDLEPAAHARDDLARPDGDDDLVGAAPAGQPAGGDARAVPRELGRRAVRVPDDDLGARPVGGEHLEDPVRADAEVVVAEPPDERRLQRAADVSPLDEQVVVAEPVPLRESHRRPRPEDDRRER